MTEERVLGIIADLCSGIEAVLINTKERIAEITGVKETQVKEEVFNLKYEGQVGSRIGEFEVANRNGQNEAFDRAFDILKQNNATIADRYRVEGFIHSYWIYQDRVYRQKLKT